MRFRLNRRMLGVACTLLLSAAAHAAEPLQSGDIVFHTSRSSQSLAIQRATGSRYSHMGIVLFREGKPFVLEAIEPVSLTPLDVWVARGERGDYAALRLKDSAAKLTPEALARLDNLAEPLLGTHYDSFFGWSDQRMYCSELVYKLYERAFGVKLCALRRLDSFDLEDPVVRKKLRERYGAKIPLGEPVVAPSDLFASPLLRPVSVAPAH